MRGCNGKECMDWDSAQAGIVIYYVNQRCLEEEAAQVTESELWDYLQWSAFQNYRPTYMEARPCDMVSAPASWIRIPVDFGDMDQTPEESAVHIHERVYMDRLVGELL